MMNPKTEQKLVGYGCTAVFIGICACIYLAFMSHWAYSVGVVSLIGIGSLLVRIGERYDLRRHEEILRIAFAQSGVPIPKLQNECSYGFWHFTLTFSSEADLNQTNTQDCIAAFKQEIQTLYQHTGPKNNPFDIERAVWVTYVGWKFPEDAFHFGDRNDQNRNPS